MDPNIVDDPDYAEQCDEAFAALPSLSLVFAPEAFFQHTTGIHQRSQSQGSVWEGPLDNATNRDLVAYNTMMNLAYGSIQSQATFDALQKSLDVEPFGNDRIFQRRHRQARLGRPQLARRAQARTDPTSSPPPSIPTSPATPHQPLEPSATRPA